MSDAEQYVLAIDLGTSGPKVAIVRETGEVLHCEVEATELILLDQIPSPQRGGGLGRGGLAAPNSRP